LPFGTQFLKILCLKKILNKIVGVIGRISFDIQDIFLYQNAIEGQFLSQKKMFFSTFGNF
jgi:hypothetical protein